MVGDSDGGGGGREGKRMKPNSDGLKIVNEYSIEQLKKLRDMKSSDSDDDSDIDDISSPKWSNIDLSKLGRIVYSKDDNVAVTDDEELNIMSPFINAKYIPNKFEPYDDDEKKNSMEYYNKKPPPVMSIVAQSGNRDSFMNCDRLLSIFTDFDDRKYRKPSNEEGDEGEDVKEDESKPSASETVTKKGGDDKKAERVITDATKPDNVLLSVYGHRAYNTAEDLLMKLMIDNLEDFAAGALSNGGNNRVTNKYNYKTPVFADDGKSLYLGGVEYEGGGVIFDGEKYVGKVDGEEHVGKEYVGGNRRNVIVMVSNICYLLLLLYIYLY